MARLVVNPGSREAWEIQLKPGGNSIGRGFANDFKITDPSVSGSHCQILVQGPSATIKDLGSTNGTFVNRAPVTEASLQTGQTIHLGGVEMVFYGDGAQMEGVAMPPPPSVRLAAATPRAAVAEPEVPTIETAPPLPPPMPAAPTALPRNCKHHPKTQGRYFCHACQQAFCELCVNSRMVAGAAHKFCRHCGAECTPLQVQIVRAPAPKGFFARLPGAFVYPFRGSGLLVLLVSTFIFTLLRIVRGPVFVSLGITIVATGYLFSYMQNIIHATANQEEEMPELPGFDEVFGACFRLLACVLISFGFAIAVLVYKISQAPDIIELLDSLPSIALSLIAPVLFGCLYFPMALLAVAMKDSAWAANPLVVIPAIFRVPLEYLTASLLVVGIFLIRWLGSMVAGVAGSASFSTRSMSTLGIALVLQAVWSLVSVYLLTVTVRILGLLYLTKKDRLGWFSR